MKLACLLASFVVAFPFQASADPRLDALLAAYPDRLASYTDNELIWKDGTRMPLGSAQPEHAVRRIARSGRHSRPVCHSLSAVDSAVPGPRDDEDPGRLRNEAFFLKMYGDCRKGEVTPSLRAVSWLPNHGGGTVRATAVNGVADQLEKVSRELDLLPAAMIQYLVPTSGTYNCRPIAETSRLSVHAFGAAIDINARFGDYWLWSKRPDGAVVWRNRIPKEIVEIFERHGFIWGGRWYHFDSLHFEYRPELIALAKQGWPRE